MWHATLYWYPKNWAGYLVTTVYDLKEERYPDLAPNRTSLLRAKRNCILRADQIICISDSTRRDVLDVYGVSPDSVHAIPLGVEAEFYLSSGSASSETSPIDEPFILYVGRRDHFKNFSVLLNAYSEWSLRDQIRLVAVGPTFTKQEVALARAGGVEDRLTCLTVADDTILLSLYRSALALVYPSLYEGFGLPLLEAMASGCPTVASRIPTSVEIAGDAALFFDPKEPNDLLDALDQAISDGRSSSRVGRGLERSHIFDWDSAARATLDVYAMLDS